MKKDEFLLKPEIIKVELDKLKLDLSNVRFIHLKKTLTEKEMEDAIWKERDTESLYNQIISAKGLYEKPVINKEFVVIEGNRRIVCLRRLKALANAGKLPGFSKNYFDIVECEMIPPDATKEQIDLFLAVKHVKGKKEWPTFNRAKMIFNLHNIYGRSYDFLAKHLGMGKITVIRMADVYEQTERYGRRFKDDKEWYHKFTYFDELYKRRDLKEFRSLQKNVDMFANWVYEGKFSDVRDVRLLAPVLADPDALRTLERGKFSDALKILEKKNPALKSKTFKQIEKVTELIRSFPRKELLKTVRDPERIKMLEQLRDELNTLLKDIYELEKKVG